MPYLREIWIILLDVFTLGAERGNLVSLSLLLVAGVAALFAGRRLFWILAAILGYIAGSLLAPYIVGPIPLISGLLGIAIGLLVALLAATNEAVVAYPIVFVATALVALLVVDPLPLARPMGTVAALLAGVVSVLLLRRAYDPILIGLSAFYGAIAILGALARFALGSQAMDNGLLFSLLLIAGIAVQTLLLWRERRNPLVVPASAGGLAPRKRRARRRYRPQPAAIAAQTAIPPELFGLDPAPPLVEPVPGTSGAASPAAAPAPQTPPAAHG